MIWTIKLKDQMIEDILRLVQERGLASLKDYVCAINRDGSDYSIFDYEKELEENFFEFIKWDYRFNLGEKEWDRNSLLQRIIKLETDVNKHLKEQSKFIKNVLNGITKIKDKKGEQNHDRIRKESN
jgi:hypothetical protein